MVAVVLTLGCGKKTGPPLTSAPAAQPCLTAWKLGQEPAAVSKFVKTDWTARPLFAADSALSLSEGQFKSKVSRTLTIAAEERIAGELAQELDSLKRLVSAVAQTGRAAAAKGDTNQARECFKSLKQCGTALNGPENTLLAQLVGQAGQKLGNAELNKLTTLAPPQQN